MKILSFILCALMLGFVAQAAEAKKEEPKKEATVTAEKAAVENAAAAKAAANEAGVLTASDKEHTYFDEFVKKVQQGGFTMYILMALSVLGIAKIFERLVNLNRGTIASANLAEEANRLYTAGKFDDLRNLCQRDKSILGRIVLAMVDHRECSRADIQSISDDIGSREMRIQMQKSYPLAIVATLSPLLGLFGTVLGMIGAFDTVAQAGDMGNASILADDIATALVTTGGGLAVAIPMLGFYHYYRTRTNKYAIILEEEVSALFSAWFLRADASKGAQAPAAVAAGGDEKGEGNQ